LLASIGAPPVAFEAEGCPACGGTGYVGRIGLYESVVIDDTLRAQIHAGASEPEMAAHAFRASEPLLTSGLRCAAAGTTSFSDVMRSVGSGQAD
jgi:general secretion pathway protein E